MLRINAASMRKSAAFIRGRRLIKFLLVLRRLFAGGVYSREAFIRVITVITVSQLYFLRNESTDLVVRSQ